MEKTGDNSMTEWGEG